jgi:hypothetical protein
VAKSAGAKTVTAPIGKGAAIKAGLAVSTGDIVCLIDGDIQYFGDPPLVALLVQPIILDIADVCISDLYWRPLYPQQWLHGFFAPVAGLLFPEMLPKVGSTPWSGQRAARRELWPTQTPKDFAGGLEMPDDFTVDLHLLLHWNRNALRMRPVLADDWVNPQRPKPDLMSRELDVLIDHAIADRRIDETDRAALREWYDDAHAIMADYDPDYDEPQVFERRALARSMSALRARMGIGSGIDLR